MVNYKIISTALDVMGDGQDLELRKVLSTFKLKFPNSIVFLDFDKTLVKGDCATNMCILSDQPFNTDPRSKLVRNPDGNVKPGADAIAKDLFFDLPFLTQFLEESKSLGIPVQILSNGHHQAIVDILTTAGITVGEGHAIHYVNGNGGAKGNKYEKVQLIAKEHSHQAVLFDDDRRNDDPKFHFIYVENGFCFDNVSRLLGMPEIKPQPAIPVGVGFGARGRTRTPSAPHIKGSSLLKRRRIRSFLTELNWSELNLLSPQGGFKDKQQIVDSVNTKLGTDFTLQTLTAVSLREARELFGKSKSGGEEVLYSGK